MFHNYYREIRVIFINNLARKQVFLMNNTILFYLSAFYYYSIAIEISYLLKKTFSKCIKYIFNDIVVKYV